MRTHTVRQKIQIMMPLDQGGDRVSRTPPVVMVCADLFGTTVADEGMVEKAIAEAIGTQGIVPGTAAYARCMVQAHQASGEPGLSIFRRMFPGNDAGARWWAGRRARGCGEAVRVPRSWRACEPACTARRGCAARAPPT